MDYAPALLISIHAPHEGERPLQRTGEMMQVIISIHAPHEGERPEAPADVSDMSIISIHAPHEGERPLQRTGEMMQVIISIHAPHEGERLCFPDNWSRAKINFNPRSPRGGATIHCLFSFVFWYIFQSTLPTRGSDYKDRTKYTAPTPISIHAPHEGERPAVSRAVIACSRISIHAPHEGERPAPR